jgi:hypothetical protein
MSGMTIMPEREFRNVISGFNRQNLFAYLALKDEVVPQYRCRFGSTKCDSADQMIDLL